MRLRGFFVREDSGSVRVKLPIKLWRELGVADKGVFRAVVRGYRFEGRYDTSSCWRLRIPNLYHALFHQELGDGGRIRLQVWVEDGVPCVAYREDEPCVYVPEGRFPLYNRGYKYCPRCKVSREGRDVRCPVCHAVMRSKPKKRKKHVKYILLNDLEG